MKRKSYPLLPEFRIERVGESTIAAHTAMKTRLDSAQLACAYWQQVIQDSACYQADKEMLVTVVVNTRLLPLGHHLVSLGSLNETVAHPREIFRPAVIAAAYGMILMHNHPSGDPSPSQADHQLTRNLRQAAEILRITLLDHVVVGAAGSYYSFREAGLL